MTQEPAAVLDDMLCFAVYTLQHRITRIYRELLEPYGLSYTQFLVLTVLHAREDRLSVRELGELLDLDSGTLSPLIRRLEQRGLVARSRGVDDERVVHVTLTDEGTALRGQLGDVLQCVRGRLDLDEGEGQAVMASLRLANARLAA